VSVAARDRNLEARIEALRRELAGLIVTLSNAGQRLEDLADELRSRRQADTVVALGQWRGFGYRVGVRNPRPRASGAPTWRSSGPAGSPPAGSC